MGIVSSTLATGAIRLAWICQMLLDPKYSSIGDDATVTAEPPLSKPIVVSTTISHQDEQQKLRRRSESPEPALLIVAPERPLLINAKSASLPLPSKSKLDIGGCSVRSQYQENRTRRAAQLRFKTRPSSFDAALIVRGKSKSSVVVTSTPSPLRRNVRVWEASSSSGCSSDSASNSDSDSETELRVSENVSNEEGAKHALGVSAEEEAAFRLTIGRGHFSRSKKDRFLNHLRLEKRLNELNNECLGLACKQHRRHTPQRRHSGDLHRII